jgi:ribosome-associated protein
VGAAGATRAPIITRMLVVDERLRVPLRELQFTFVRSSGAGGQNVNKVSTKAVLRWDVAASPGLPEGVRERFLSRYRRRITSEGELVLSSQRFRDQGKNVADCLEKLRAMLAEVAVERRPRKRTRPTRGGVERRLRAKRRRALTKERRRPPAPEAD